jgi:hypothetical protein
MKFTSKSWLLLGIALGIGLLNLANVQTTPPEMVQVLPPVTPASVVRIEISSPIEKLTLQRTNTEKGSADAWEIIAPVQAEADAAQISALLKLFAGGVKMEAKVDEGNLKNYGLDDQDAKVVELFGAEGPAIFSVVVGRNTVGGTSFIRLPGTEEVYRADVGGRARYDRGASEWRNRQVLQLDPENIQVLTLTRGAEVLRFTRGQSKGSDEKGRPLPGEFSLEKAPFAIDTAIVEEIVGILSRIRVGSFQNPNYDGGFSPPAATAELQLADGSRHQLVLGSRSNNEASFLKLDAIPEVLRATVQVNRAMTIPLEVLKDRSLLHFERSELEAMALTDGGLTVVIEPVPDSARWVVVQPANLDVDQRGAEALATALATLRADGVAADNSFAPTGARLELRLKGGTKQVLEWGQHGRRAGGFLVGWGTDGHQPQHRPRFWLRRHWRQQRCFVRQGR